MLNLKKLRLHLLFSSLPYVAITAESLNSFIYFIPIILIVGLLDFFFIKNDTPSKRFLYAFLFISLNLFLYGSILLDIWGQVSSQVRNYTGKNVSEFIKVFSDIKYFIFIFLVLLVIIYYFFFYKKQNTFFKVVVLLFCFTSLLKNVVFTKTKTQQIVKYERDALLFDEQKDIEKKKLLLIILDEYASPQELRKVDPSRNYNGFIDYLNKNNWSIKESFKSLEASTINSLASLFNYNLNMSNPELFTKVKNPNSNFSYILDREHTTESFLVNDLKQKGIKIKSYGLFPFERSSVSDFEYYNEKKTMFLNIGAFIDIFKYLEKSEFLYTILKKTFLKSIEIKYFLQKYKNNVFDSFHENEIEKYDFLYYHFLMPHTPFRFNDEFKYEGSSTSQYLKFWEFTNKKIIEILKKIEKKDYRIIISGDHGYRGDKAMEKLNTFSAFYGFSEDHLEKVKTVQDIGSLINYYSIGGHIPSSKK